MVTAIIKTLHPTAFLFVLKQPVFMINVDDRLVDELHECELFLLMKVARFMRSNRMTAWPSVETLADRCNWDERTVKKWRKSLVGKGVLRMKQRPGTTPIYEINGGIGVFYSLGGKQFTEDENNDEGGQKMGGAKNVPPTKNVPPEGGQKMYPEVINESIEAINEIDTPTPLKEKKAKAKKVTPGPPHAIRKMAELFDAKLEEKGERKFTWKAGEGRNFKALNDLKAVIEKEISAAGKVELSDENFEQAYGYILEYGFQYLSGIAQKRGGAIEFKPSALLNNYNAIINHARAKHKRVNEAHEVRRRAEQWNDYGDD